MLQATKILKTQNCISSLSGSWLMSTAWPGRPSWMMPRLTRSWTSSLTSKMPWYCRPSFFNLNNYNFFQYQAYFEKDETLKEEKMKKAQEETLPKSLVSLIEPNQLLTLLIIPACSFHLQANLEKLLEKRGGQYFVGNR